MGDICNLSRRLADGGDVDHHLAGRWKEKNGGVGFTATHGTAPMAVGDGAAVRRGSGHAAPRVWARCAAGLGTLRRGSVGAPKAKRRRPRKATRHKLYIFYPLVCRQTKSHDSPRLASTDPQVRSQELEATQAAGTSLKYPSLHNPQRPKIPGNGHQRRSLTAKPGRTCDEVPRSP